MVILWIRESKWILFDESDFTMEYFDTRHESTTATEATIAVDFTIHSLNINYHFLLITGKIYSICQMHQLIYYLYMVNMFITCKFLSTKHILLNVKWILHIVIYRILNCDCTKYYSTRFHIICVSFVRFANRIMIQFDTKRRLTFEFMLHKAHLLDNL